MHARHDQLQRESAPLPPWCPALPEPVRLFSREAIRAVDRAAVERYGIPSIVLMENAARGLLEVALDMLPEAPRAAPVIIFCGSGNNGGDGYALARHLAIAGYRVEIIASKSPKQESDAGTNAAICQRMEIPVKDLDSLRDDLPRPSLVVDAIFGTGLDRPVEGDAKRHITWINDCAVPVLAVDVPSGMDAETGEALGLAVVATRTVTFAGLKSGFVRNAAEPFVGRLTIAPIGAPAELLEEFGEVWGGDAD